MKSTANPRIALYRQAIALEEKRASLQAELDQLLSRLSTIKSELFDESSSGSGATAVSPRRLGGRRARRGELKAQILRTLVAAGKAGVRVKDLAATLGAKTANIHSWFQTATKRHKQIKKIGEARYRLEGALPDAVLNGPKPKGKASKSRRKGSTRPLSGRGELAARITGALKDAGKEGLKVRALADKLGVKHRNLFIWFATTGKKNKAIKKVGEAHYRLDS